MHANTPVLLPLLYVACANVAVLLLTPGLIPILTVPATLVGLLTGLFHAREEIAS